ncbi:MAG: hypothetical protein KDH94_00750, partial [Coxiellaceae bacterium]|nr:hypothetical protein [Coxiellaceae bacterium]
MIKKRLFEGFCGVSSSGWRLFSQIDAVPLKTNRLKSKVIFGSSGSIKTLEKPKVIERKKSEKIAYFFLILSIILIYGLTNFQYTGPAYLSDEIGYLSKAAAFAGYPVDMSSSWHGGYSLMLAPLFVFFSDPSVIWRGVVFLNVFMWAISFFLLFKLLVDLFPEKNFWVVLSSVGVSAIYPAWITMSGYAFSTPAFVLVYMVALNLLLHSKISDISWILYSFSVGFLYWIHPIGLAVIFVSLFISIILFWRFGNFFRLIFHVLIVLLLVVIYQFFLHPYLNYIMTPENFTSGSHYPPVLKIIDSFRNIEFLSRFFLISIGQFSYLLISTFGLVVYGLIEMYYNAKYNMRSINNQPTNIFTLMTISLMAFSIFAIIFMGSASFSLSNQNRID